VRNKLPDGLSETDVRLALAKVLVSAEFAKSKKIQILLENIVEKTLSGKSHEIKAYTIGLDVFDRSPDFDPDKDAIVRVEMGRLRKKLKYYYLTEGKDDCLQIIVPKGTYCPSFVVAQRHQSLVTRLKFGRWAKLLPVEASLALTGGMFFAILSVVVLFLFVNEDSQPNQPSDKSLKAGIIVKVYPFKLQSTKLRANFATEIRDYLLTNLIRYKTLGVVAVKQPISPAILKKSANRPGIYHLSGTLYQVDGKMTLNISVLDLDEQSMLWSKRNVLSGTDEENRKNMLEFLDLVSIRLASYSGVIWSDALKHLDERIEQFGKDSLTSEECVMLYHGYDQNKDQRKYPLVRDCLNRFTDAGTSNGSVWGAWAFLHFLDWTKDQLGVDVAKALTAARKAVNLDPDNANNHEILGSILMATGEKSEALAQYRKAIELNPLKPDLHVLVGWQEVLIGNWDVGVAKIQKGVNAHISPPGWMRIPLSIDAFRRNDYRTALFQAETIIQSGDNRGIILALSAAVALKDKRLADKYRKAYLAYEKATPSAPLSEIKGVFNAPAVLGKYAETLENTHLAPAM